ncbi:cell cycle checkpoint protein RAD17-like [Sitodiplosis mosellana]|uniref:cell cycle checkpoint protein RAD17-like n=1 Tax=Sitodiplosis mosellana TaxID=263140 RepID=UPI002444BBE2|nr:cell cycle checkpoint protein RAD17-like [Sitodiplosis mosellana]XP_055326416.1 cell cycle checkpoint protein RAD17-like [Sitodiplosis mosellana]
MATKQKKWFKSAFDAPQSPAVNTQKRPKMQSVFSNEDDSINFSELDLSSLDNNNQTTAEIQKPTAEVTMIHTDFKSSNWIENFAPRTKVDLAIHAKKVAEVEDWFRVIKDKRMKNAAPIVLVTGPSGSGKSATIKIIAQEFGYTISEWVTPMDLEHPRYDRTDNDKVTFSESQIDKFTQFLFQSSRYRSVFDTATKRLVLVEDFPNIFIKDPSSFEEVLERYSSYGKSPLIFIVADTKSRTLNISFNLFTDEIRSRFNITSISFNPVADTMLKKGLKRICDIMGQNGFKKYYTEPSKDTIESIVLSSQGDIRSAVINLHFASQKNSTMLPVQSLNLNKKTKNTKKSKSKLKSLGTDENITVLHALGRVFNPKYKEEADALGNKTFLHSPDEITSLLTTQPTTSINLIHHNYITHFQRLEEIISAIDCISHSDVMLNEWRSDLCAEIGVGLAVRGVMTANENPVTGRWMPVRSAKNQLKTNEYDKERKDFGISLLVSSNNFACDYRTYIKLIPKVEATEALNTTEIIE